MSRTRHLTTVVGVCAATCAGGLAVSAVGLRLGLTGWWLGGGAVGGLASMGGFYLLGRAHEAIRAERKGSL